MAYVENQTFLETPDGVTRIFTTTQAFLPESLLVTQGGLTVSNYRTIESTGIVFDTAPNPDNGTLLWAGEQASTTGATLPTNAFWSLPDFRAAYGISGGDDFAVSFALTRADVRLQQYLDATVYADAIATTPTEMARAWLIRSAAGDLARGYLQQSAIISGIVAARSESYRGVKTYQESFVTSAEASMSAAQREGDILTTLAAWQRITIPAEGEDAAGVVWWNTGRIPY